MDPYTPRARSRLKKDKLMLSAKQYSKIAGTIASVRRDRLGDADDDEDVFRLDSSEPSFIAEKSFVAAPLNSRVPVHFATTNKKGKQKAESLDRVSLDVQEALILEDLLFVLMGIEGTYITYPPEHSFEDESPLAGVRFVASPSLDPSLRDLVERVLPLATFYTAITEFVQVRSHLDYGLVNHALCAAIRDMMKEYHTLLSQLEHAFQHSPTFSLQKLWFYVHPTLHTLSLIYGLITEIIETEEPLDSESGSNESDDDPEERARNEALGLGGAELKVLVNEMTKSGGPNGATAGPAKGGEVLTVLYERMQRMSGDPSALALHRALLRAAGRPYAQMLVAWTRGGKLDDPYEEFCVKESRFIAKEILDADFLDEYWERRYTLRDGSTPTGGPKGLQAGVPSPRIPGGRLPCGACIPPLLESWKHKVFLAGKYLNVLQECGKEVKKSVSLDEDDFAMESDKFYKSIEDAYSVADKSLVRVLMHDEQLIPRLRSLRNYFFLSQSSFLTHFLDAAHSELRKSARGANVDKLQSLLDVALNTDGCSFVPEGEPTFKEDVKTVVGKTTLYEYLSKILDENGIIGDVMVKDADLEIANDEGKRSKDKDDKGKLLAIDAFTLDYKVKFPLSLVLSRRTILKYQMIFRFLLHLRSTEQALSAMWMDHMTEAWQFSFTRPGEEEKYQDLARWRHDMFLLRARMLAFVQQLLAFVTSQVLEPNWRRLEAALSRVNTVDALLRVHFDYLDTCMKESMLTSASLMKTVGPLVMTCATFSMYTSSFTRSAISAQEEQAPEVELRGREKRREFLRRFGENFDLRFNHFFDRVQYAASSEIGALLPLVTRLASVRSTRSSA